MDEPSFKVYIGLFKFYITILARKPTEKIYEFKIWNNYSISKINHTRLYVGKLFSFMKCHYEKYHIITLVTIILW